MDHDPAARWITSKPPLKNNEGYLSRQTIEQMLAERGAVSVVPVDYKRYVGAQIGIHNPSGVKVGRVSHLRNTEYVFIAGPKPVDLSPFEAWRAAETCEPVCAARRLKMVAQAP